MNYRHILRTLFIILILISCISFISASEGVELGGMKFNIPDGYQFVQSDTDLNDGYGCYIYSLNDNNPSNDIIINVNVDSSSSDENVVSSTIVKNANEVDKRVNDVDGFYAADTSTFTYQDGKYLVSIQAPEDLLDEIVTGKYYDSVDASSDDTASDDIATENYYGSADASSDDIVSDNQGSMDPSAGNFIAIIFAAVILVGGGFIYLKVKKNKNDTPQSEHRPNNAQRNTSNIKLPTDNAEHNRQTPNTNIAKTNSVNENRKVPDKKAELTEFAKRQNCNGPLKNEIIYKINEGSITDESQVLKLIKDDDRENTSKEEPRFGSVKDYIYNIALLASEKKLNDADELLKEAKETFPSFNEEFDDAKKVGIKSQDISFSYSVSCPKCNTTIKVFTGYCPTCGYQYVKAPKGKWMFDTPQEYVYKIEYYGREGKLAEASELVGEAKEHFPEDAEKFDNALLGSTLANVMMKKYK